MRRGIATFTLDYGKCPPWLFERMVKLGREIIRVMVIEYGPHEVIRRIGDPVWFQSLGTVLAFDWNASGLTTILTAALKEAIFDQEQELGIFICGGKGKTSKKTPIQIEEWGEVINAPVDSIEQLSYSSKMAAKVDSALVQDGYQLYHHAFFFSYEKRLASQPHITWTVVQQGMNTASRTARRYHWHDEIQDKKEFVDEPHTGIASQTFHPTTLDMTAHKSGKTRAVSTELLQQGYHQVYSDLQLLRKHFSPYSHMFSFKKKSSTGQSDIFTFLQLSHREFHHHPVEAENFADSSYIKKILDTLTEQKPKTYEQMLATRGVGPKTVRALALVAEVIYGAAPSYEDPARYSFAHGGKDGTPYPVDKDTYDQTIAMLSGSIRKSKLSITDKNKMLSSLHK